MLDKVLCVDDEPHILKAYKRNLQAMFDIETATSGSDALSMVSSQGPFAVIVSDMRMPVMDGIQFLKRAKTIAPDTVRIMLTGNTDQQTAIEAVNQGNIFRFLTKPCPPEDLAHAIEAGIHQYKLITAEREVLEKTLMRCVDTLTDILAIVNPIAFGLASRVKRWSRELGATLKIENTWQVEMAAMLSQIGCITIPETILTRFFTGAIISNDEWKMVHAHPQIGHDLIFQIPRLDEVAEMIRNQDKSYNDPGLPDDPPPASAIRLGSNILKVAIDFDRLLQSRFSHYEAHRRIQEKAGSWYDPAIVEALSTVLSHQITREIRSVKVMDLEENMILAEDVFSAKGVLLVSKGQEVTASLHFRLCNYLKNGLLSDPARVLVN